MDATISPDPSTSVEPPPGAGRVAYQGAPGAFSHEACLALRPWDEAVPFASFAEALQAVATGDCGCALIPVENSTVGVVEPAATLVREAGLEQVTEVWRPIRLALMALPDATEADIRVVESHPIALKQCGRQLSELGIEAREVFDTAGAARAIGEGTDRTRAALAPIAAADIYGLSILRHDLQDSTDNRTRFVLLCASEG